MSEARLLRLVMRYPDPSALARHAPDGLVFSGLRRLEGRGLLTYRHGLYRLTRRGVDELAATIAVSRLVAG